MSDKLAKRESGGIHKYDPETGMKRLAVAEAAEKHFKRAKDAEALQRAVEVKLTEQRNFVLWWDTQPFGRGGNPTVTDRKQLAGKDGLPDRQTIHRWRSKLKSEGSFTDALNAAKQRCIEICEMAKSAHITAATGYYEWYTPKEIIDIARNVMGGIGNA